MPITIESLRAGDEGQRHDQLSLAFARPSDRNKPFPPFDQVVCAYDGDRLVAGAAVIDEGQYYGGRVVPSGGIASVAVLPDMRGLDLARRVMREAFVRMLGMGAAISALYPTTSSLYRSLGYEQSGTNVISRLALSDLPSSAPAGHTFAPCGFDEVREQYDAMALRFDGWLERRDDRWAAIRYDYEKSTDQHAAFCVHRNGSPVGAILYRQSQAEVHQAEINAQLFAQDIAALRALLALAAGHSTIAVGLRTQIPEWELCRAIDQSHRIRQHFAMKWMTRVLDAPAAIAARGYNPHVDAEVHVHLQDDALAMNNGPFVLRVRDGAGTLEPGGRGDVPLDIRELAAYYTGYRTEHPALTAAFAGRPPTLVDFF